MAVTTKDEYKSLGDVQYLSIDYCYTIILIYNKNLNDYRKRVTPNYLFYDVLYFSWNYPLEKKIVNNSAILLFRYLGKLIKLKV